VTSTTVPGDGPTTTEPPAEIDGTWSLAADGRSFAGYRVEEELARIGFTTAVGRSTAVEGSLTIDATTVTGVEVRVDMTALESDSSSRDGAIRGQALETTAFPEASFVTTEPIPLPENAPSGEPFSIDAAGDLTLHGVTRNVVVPLEAQLAEGNIVVVGSLPILFADYDIERPSAAVVLSVDDEGIMEFQLVFERS
jgi:polyisoprenoid-binding protein YceI